jgi:hypothetical protein
MSTRGTPVSGGTVPKIGSIDPSTHRGGTPKVAASETITLRSR